MSSFRCVALYLLAAFLFPIAPAYAQSDLAPPKPGLAVPTTEQANAHLARFLETKDLKLDLPITKFADPVAIKSAEELEKQVKDKHLRAALLKLYKPDKEQLLIFHWQGSGQDKLGAAVDVLDKKISVTITLERGRTRDLRGHWKLLALPLEAKWKVEGGK